MYRTPDEIWYRQPADLWQQALPLGNGRLGAMVYGGIGTERIDLTESTFVSGELSQHNNRPGATEAFRATREALLRRDYAAGNEIADGMTGLRGNFGTNLPVGRLILDFGDAASSDGYRRSLDISRAISRVEVGSCGREDLRECFLSHLDAVLAMRITGERSFTIQFESDCPFTVSTDGCDLLSKVRARETVHSDGRTGVTLNLRLRVAAPGGTVTARGGALAVASAGETVVLLAMNTDYIGSDAFSECLRQIDTASALGYSSLLERHVKDFAALSGRCTLTMGDSPDLPADCWLDEIRSHRDDGALAALLFRYGRYLFLCSSREDSPLPAHLQGAWNDGVACRIGWSCDMHLDINTEMNYWPAHVTGLHECTWPLHRWVAERLLPSGRKTAHETYGLDGWVAHTVSNAWGYSAPGQSIFWGLHVTGGTWIASHLWEYWLNTGDKAFLSDVAYPVIRGAVEFFIGYLVQDGKTGYALPVPSNSPENSFLVNGQAMALSEGAYCDIVMIRELFSAYEEMCAVLGLDGNLRQKALVLAQSLPHFRVGRHGQLQEWLSDFEEANPNHRHASHLLSLFPFAEITPDGTPELAAAARKTINRRLNAEQPWEDTGWARSLLILYAARLWDGQWAGEHVLSMLRTLTNDNLLVFHPPVAGADTNVYELDGNTGLTSGIAEMLLQSYGGVLHLLPALPPEWKNGCVTGLCGRRGFIVDLCWREGALVEALVTSRAGAPCRLRYCGRVIGLDIAKGESKRLVFGATGSWTEESQ